MQGGAGSGGPPRVVTLGAAEGVETPPTDPGWGGETGRGHPWGAAHPPWPNGLPPSSGGGGVCQAGVRGCWGDPRSPSGSRQKGPNSELVKTPWRRHSKSDFPPSTTRRSAPSHHHVGGGTGRGKTLAPTPPRLYPPKLRSGLVCFGFGLRICESERWRGDPE